MLLKALRKGVGSTIVFLNWVTLPKKTPRSPEDQAKVENVLKNLSLYQLHACPFCIKTRRALHRLNADIRIKDIGKDKTHRTELENGGGRVMVPCLKIDEGDQASWMYESSDIIDFLETRIQQAIV